MLDLSLAPAQRHRGLTVRPLLTVGDEPFGFDLLEDAVSAETLTITEIGSGTVPALLAVNDGERDVVILDGQQFLGARQNRMASRSIVLPAKSHTKIPVNCMEQGRWHETGRAFRPSDYHSPSNVRKHNKKREAAAVAEGRPADVETLSTAQGDVWSEIAMHSSDMEVHSATGALDEVTRRRGGDVREYVARFPAIPGQVGILAFVGSEPLGIDAVHDRTLWARLHARIVGGYVQDALRRPDVDGEPDPEAAESYLAAVRAAGRSEAPTVGAGSYRVLTGTVTGGELVDDDRTVHLTAFPLDG